MKKMIVVLFMLMSVSLMAQTYGTNGWKTDVKELVNKQIYLDSANSVQDSVYFETGKMSFDADSVSFLAVFAGDSASKTTSPYQNVGCVGKIEWLSPVGNKTRFKWADYTAYVTKAANANTPIIFGNSITRLNSQLFGNTHWLVYNSDATPKTINVKIYVIKYWRTN